MKIYPSKFIPQRSGTRCLIRCVSRPSWNVLCRSCRSHQSCNNECALKKKKGYFPINLWVSCRNISMQMHVNPAVRKTCSLGCWAESERLKWRRKDSHLQIITNVILYGFNLDVFWVVHVFLGGLQLRLSGSPSPKRTINFGNLPMLNNQPDNPIQSLVDGWWWGSACISSRSSNMTWRCDGGDEEDNIQIPIQKIVWREFHLKESFQSFYASFLCHFMIQCWSEFFLVLRFPYGKYPVDTSTGRPSTRCSKRRTWAKHWRTLSWCISTGKQWFALHISGHLLLLSLELLFGWVGKMVWKLPKWRFFIVSFVFVLRQEQRSKLHHCCCQRAWGQKNLPFGSLN